MAYATLSELKVRLGSASSPPGLYEQITDRLNATTANDTVGQALLDSASAIIDQRLARRYAVPIDTSDAVAAAWLRHATLVIACWTGWVEHPTRAKNKDTVADEYRAIDAALTAIADGAAALPSAGVLAPATGGGTVAKSVGWERDFTEENARGVF
ncbi:MAG: phage protein Gp36 family protein [Phycisphaerae bacterium]